MVEKKTELNIKEIITAFYFVGTISITLSFFIIGYLTGINELSNNKIITLSIVSFIGLLIYTLSTITIFKKIQESVKE